MYLDNAIASIGEDGALFIESAEMYGVDYAVEPWSRGLTAYSNKNGTWQKCRIGAELNLVTFRYLADVDLVIHKFISEIPIEVCKAVKEIRYLQLAILRTAANSRDFCNLLLSTPMLAWMLVDHAIKSGWNYSQINMMLQQKQTIILDEISGVHDKSYIRLLRSIQIDEGSEKELGIILNSMRSGLKRSLHHQKKVPIIVLELLDKAEFFNDSKLIAHFIKHPPAKCSYLFGDGIQYLRRFWQDTLKTGLELQILDAEKVLKACRNPDELFNVHDRWVARYNKNSLEDFEDVTFPEPPIPETSAIIGIRSYADLLEEGRMMEHCVGLKRDQIVSGESYIYRVLEPQRGTLEVNRSCNKNCGDQILRNAQGEYNEQGYFNEWEIEEFRLNKNVLPDEKSWDTVNTWMDHYFNGLREEEDPNVYREAKWGAS